ncbi:DUF1993 domain-containing protein [Bradyrhizobium sp. U87765 SZCCT0131]|uniref:DUF1993 domain-containing protein n=1 Tax=unclassified Bradyrhizobium TaxID=2631580 RepID=UPI001BA779ED|nr:MULTISPECIES: DUF1993 domain-containing protein [unclassified Bradyrhizobium]MBR1219217.1 DUF1993 domain-containing protein [Bradyrhizobium sp. U87765 SZCCT0131]MBR1261868.1 DUF1993 domain-containing protein [Bradyrhizobium sp. U87765 SZCCT0134]MBR1306279.1 DUF1993 domain-containing protein [Bradyrhizobium sp. U87765 SZCCT0110]MBR1317650.1 DUF1993 domain-containing protein [Bradyrhizobium sp. U87765 SZCCT0109]MBR1351352.1 DUF1993 domain-containing protein [Bradyrhizobium sp. U87765 SZCCT004
MSLSIYDLTVPTLQRGLRTLSFYLDRAQAFADERKFEVSVLLNARLAPDMLPFTGQVQRASDTAKGGVARLTGVEAPGFPDTETTVAELKERLAKTIAFLDGVTRAQFEGSAERVIEFRALPTMPGAAHLVAFVLPNFFFHLATAHDILRHNGVAIGKRDYLGANNP